MARQSTVQSSDPIELAVFSNLVAAVAEEACGTLERTAYTTFVKESNDFCVALATPDGTFFAYPRKSGVTTFIGLPLEEVIAGVADWQPGDVLLSNDPYSTGGLVTHAPDLNLISPIFFDGELVAFCWGFLHSSDVGGGHAREHRTVESGDLPGRHTHSADEALSRERAQRRPAANTHRERARPLSDVG